MYLINIADFFMSPLLNSISSRVKLMTLALLLCLTSCATINHQVQESCKSHAYIRQGLDGYLTQRFNTGAPVRLGIIPFTVPANLATVSADRPGIDNQLAWRLQADLLNDQRIPIVEFLPRQDWPGKKDEFFTGNFGAIRMGHDAGYDLVLVGYVEPLTSFTKLAAYAKLVDTDSGVTLWYGKSEVLTGRKMLQDIESYVGIGKNREDIFYSEQMIGALARCLANEVINDEQK